MDELESLWAMTVVSLMAFAFAIVVLIFFCISVQKTLEAIDPGLRDQEPGMAWLLLIPLFSVVWMFIIVLAIKKGFVRMSDEGRLSARSDGAGGIGLAMAICCALSLVPFANFIVGIPAVVLFVLYWVKIVDLRRLVRAPRSGAVSDAEFAVLRREIMEGAPESARKDLASPGGSPAPVLSVEDHAGARQDSGLRTKRCSACGHLTTSIGIPIECERCGATFPKLAASFRR